MMKCCGNYRAPPGGLSEGVRSGKHWAVHSGGCDLDRHKVGDSDFLPLM